MSDSESVRLHQKEGGESGCAAVTEANHQEKSTRRGKKNPRSSGGRDVVLDQKRGKHSTGERGGDAEKKVAEGEILNKRKDVRDGVGR